MKFCLKIILRKQSVLFIALFGLFACGCRTASTVSPHRPAVVPEVRETVVVAKPEAKAAPVVSTETPVPVVEAEEPPTAFRHSIAPGTPLSRQGDEIVAAGQLFHTGTPVVLWMDPGGYDAYRVERKFAAVEESSWKVSSERNQHLATPNRFGMRRQGMNAAELQEVHDRGWRLDELQSVVDQFVLHFDACGTSRQCFKVLHDLRGLSVHFLLDLDGTIYQTLDLKERAWHATSSNSRSIGIEIANIGAYPPDRSSQLETWYRAESEHSTRIQLPESFGDGGIRTPDFIGRPARPWPVYGRIQEKDLAQYDFTPEQYEALVKLTASLCRIFPNIRPDYPQDDKNELIPMKLTDAELNAFQGVLGHYHIQTNKVDPGPAFNWEDYMKDVRAFLNEE